MKNKTHEKITFKKVLPFILEALFFALIITFDLTMKDWLFDFLKTKPGMNFTVVEGFLDLTYSENTGAGFGMFKNSTTALTVVTAIVVVGILVYLSVFRKDSEWLRVPLVMIAAGGVGNLVDRIAFKYVRDFFEFTFMDFAIFNIADAFVTVGAIILIIYLIYVMASEAAKRNKKAAAESADTDSAGSGNDSDSTPVSYQFIAGKDIKGEYMDLPRDTDESESDTLPADNDPPESNGSGS